MMVIDNKFDIGDIVYLKTDKDQSPRMITGFLVGPMALSYRVACGTVDAWQYGIELSKEKDVILSTTN